MGGIDAMRGRTEAMPAEGRPIPAPTRPAAALPAAGRALGSEVCETVNGRLTTLGIRRRRVRAGSIRTATPATIQYRGLPHSAR
jgi:hypothetical protein